MPFSKDLTVNDIIRKIEERKLKLYRNIGNVESPANVPSRINELNALLNYIQKDGEY